MAREPMNARNDARMTARTAPQVLKKGEDVGRNGKILRREKPSTANPFDFPDAIKEAGWSYQWCRADIVGSGEFSEIAIMRRAGWDYVKPDQLEGYFAHDCKDMDHIEVAGLVLMERPQGMTDDARNDQLRAANEQFMAQLNKRADNETPLPPGVLPLMREIHSSKAEPNSNALKPTYARVAAPADDE